MLLELFLGLTVIICYSFRQFMNALATKAPTKPIGYSILYMLGQLWVSHDNIHLVPCSTI